MIELHRSYRKTKATGIINKIESFPCWLPLTTMSRREQSSNSRMERYRQLVKSIREITGTSTVEQISDYQLISVMRSKHCLRRLASLAMRPDTNNKNNRNTKDLRSPHTLPLGQRLIRIWPQLLALPQLSLPTDNANTASKHQNRQQQTTAADSVA